MSNQMEAMAPRRRVAASPVAGALGPADRPRAPRDARTAGRGVRSTSRKGGMHDCVIGVLSTGLSNVPVQ